MKIKKNDLVEIISGKNRGKKGKILRTMPKKALIVVEKVNIVKKHVKKRQTSAREIIMFEAPIHVSNAMIVCPHCDKKTRVTYIKAKDGKKERVCKKCKERLDSTLA